MQRGIIKRLGDQAVDVQLVGSTATLPGAQLSRQIDRSTLLVGDLVLTDMIDGRPVVLHTIYAGEQSTRTNQTAPDRNPVTANNALLADGTVPLMGNLSVAPGVTIDGVDISLLGDALNNLQAADTIARTGYTALSHGTHLVFGVSSEATSIVVREAMFALNEQVVLSNAAGQVEFMRIVSSASVAYDNGGAICYRYDVDRRVATSPGGLMIGWAAATLVNGLTDKGYIVVDNRHANSLGSPRITGVMWTDSPPTTGERVFQLGNLFGSANITEPDFGAAFGKLTTGDTYLLYNASRENLTLKNANIIMADTLGEETVRIYGQHESDRMAGDYTFGKESGVHNSFHGDTGTWGVYRGNTAVIEVGNQHAFLRNPLTIGNPIGARINLGEIEGRAAIVARNKFGVAKLVARTDDDGGIHFHVGNPAPQDNSLSFDDETGILAVNGDVVMQSAKIMGEFSFASTGAFSIVDPDDPQRYGKVTPRGIYGYSVDGSGQQYLSSLDAWSPLVLETRPGSGVWRTWIAGESMRGDPDNRHFRVERGPTGRVGLFNGDTPISYLGADGSGYFTGNITASGGNFSGFLNIGEGGGIYQGSGTPTEPGTGLKLWNHDGAGRIAGYANGVIQWYAGTDGKLYAGGDAVVLDAAGISIKVSESGSSAANAYKFTTESGSTAGFWRLYTSGLLMMNRLHTDGGGAHAPLTQITTAASGAMQATTFISSSNGANAPFVQLDASETDSRIQIGSTTLGLYGATPVARATTSGGAATFVANTGTAVNSASTFDGYTLRQVVKALRDIGVLT